MATPLFDAINAHRGMHRVSFHTPGHKGQAPLLEPLMSLECDLTELADVGSLYDGGDVIEQAEREAARVFGAGQTFFSGGGCTLCIQTMLALAAKRGSHVLMGRNAHRSAVHAAALLGLSVTWLVTLEPDAVEAALTSNPAIRTVYVTSPDYYGRLADISALSAVCRAHDAALLVDNAHGTHLQAFGCHPLQLGADATADSAHKTLPVLTGGAYLQLAESGAFSSLSRAEVKSAMALFGSTSPSFPVLASLDTAQDWWEREGREAFLNLYERTRPLFKAVDEMGLSPRFVRVDPVRLTLDCGDGDADVMASRLRSRGMEIEYADTRYAVLLLSPFHTDAQLDALQTAIADAWQTPLPKAVNSPFSAAMPSSLPSTHMELREAMLARRETVPMREAVGRISAQTVCPCPPGVAVIVPGERMDAALAAQLEQAGYAQLCVVK